MLESMRVRRLNHIGALKKFGANLLCDRGVSQGRAKGIRARQGKPGDRNPMSGTKNEDDRRLVSRRVKLGERFRRNCPRVAIPRVRSDDGAGCGPGCRGAFFKAPREFRF
jgi:hypothetical protein